MGNILVCAGHHSLARGAVNKKYGFNEWGLMVPFANLICDIGNSGGFNCQLVCDNRLPEKVDYTVRNKYDLALDLHLNACDETARGSEVLYWHKSQSGLMYAQWIATAMNHTVNRPLKPITFNERGSFFLHKTSCPAVIVEASFIDNDRDCINFVQHMENIARNIFAGIMLAYRTLNPVSMR